MEHLRRFLEFIPSLEEGEVYSLVYMRRGKYSEEGKNEKKIIYSLHTYTPEKISEVIKHLEFVATEVKGEDRNKGTIYLLKVPISKRKVAGEVAKIILDRLVTNQDSLLDPNKITKIEYLNTQNASKRIWNHFDFDIPNKTPELVQETVTRIKEVLDGFPYPYLMMETKGGIHVLVKSIDSQNRKKSGELFTRMIKLPFIDSRCNPEYIPIPGTLQYDFLVKIIE